MRFRLVLILLVTLAAIPALGLDRRRDQIQAAHTDALASMMDSVRAARIQDDLTVGQFLDRTGGESRLRLALQRSAQQLGATRWPNPDTCQVQLEVSGRDVAAELAAIAAQSPDKAPLPSEALRKQLATWDRQTFSATGAAMTPERAADLPPGPGQPLWLSIPDADRKAAVQAAQRDAGRRAVEGLSDVTIGDGKTVADALQVPAVRKVVQEWVSERPVVDLRFGPEGDVLVTLAAPAEELWSVFRQAASAQTEIPVPRDEAGWQRLHDEVVARLKLPTGRGAVTRTAAAPPRVPRRALPALPPRWVDDQFDADGSASGESSKLRLARAAESYALADLRARIEQLPLGDGRTVGEAAAADVDVAAAVDRSLRRARTYKVDYGVDHTVKVCVGLDLRYVWQELNRR
jgi:hypothetical protein